MKTCHNPTAATRREHPVRSYIFPSATKTAIALLYVILSSVAFSQSTISPPQQFAYGANLGWLTLRPSSSAGVNVGEYVCSGYIYAANVGWIHLGDGTPDNQIRYSNSSSTDYGVNLMPALLDGTDPVVPLRGFAYGANIGWLNFEPVGNPRINLKTGRFLGYAWAPNLGWINFNDPNSFPVTKSITPAIDSDMDTIADAWELERTGNLATLKQNGDFDGDGFTDSEEYQADTNPLSSADRFRITVMDRNPGIGFQTIKLEWTSTPSRCYLIQSNSDLSSPPWIAVSPLLTGDPGTTLAKFDEPITTRNFYRIVAQKPLPP